MALKKLPGGKNVKQFISYIFVGGSATIVEWGLFFVFIYLLRLDQNLGFIIAYVISTFVNLIMGRLFTFKHAEIVHKGKSKTANAVKETVLIYLVAAIGCLLNILFMNLFSVVFHMGSMLSKIVTTGVIFIGNYLARKLGIYKEKKPEIAAE
jgi:Predicted membrane protein